MDKQAYLISRRKNLMSKNNSLLTIKEFAAAAGVSKQTIYNQLNGRLKPFVKVINDTKMLEKSALEEFYIEKDSQLDSQPIQPVESQPVDSQQTLEKSVLEEFYSCEDSQPVNQPVNRQLNEEINEKLIRILEQQLETKDKQIEELNKRLAETLTKMANIMEQQQILLSQQQKLTLIERQEDIKEPAELEEPKAEPQPQKNFWNRLFNK